MDKLRCAAEVETTEKRVSFQSLRDFWDTLFSVIQPVSSQIPYIIYTKSHQKRRCSISVEGQSIADYFAVRKAEAVNLSVDFLCFLGFVLKWREWRR